MLCVVLIFSRAQLPYKVVRWGPGTAAGELGQPARLGGCGSPGQRSQNGLRFPILILAIPLFFANC